MGEITSNRNFAINDEGIIYRADNGMRQNMDKEILDLIEVSSYSHRIFASYDARLIAYKICESSYKWTNYKDYVEMLMRKNCPIEYEKAELGRKFKICKYVSYIPFAFVITVPFMIYFKKKHKALCLSKKQ